MFSRGKAGPIQVHAPVWKKERLWGWSWRNRIIPFTFVKGPLVFCARQGKFKRQCHNGSIGMISLSTIDVASFHEQLKAPLFLLLWKMFGYMHTLWIRISSCNTTFYKILSMITHGLMNDIDTVRKQGGYVVIVNVIYCFTPQTCEATVWMSSACNQVDITLICLSCSYTKRNDSHYNSFRWNMVQVFVFFGTFTDFVPDFSGDVFG